MTTARKALAEHDAQPQQSVLRATAREWFDAALREASKAARCIEDGKRHYIIQSARNEWNKHEQRVPEASRSVAAHDAQPAAERSRQVADMLDEANAVANAGYEGTQPVARHNVRPQDVEQAIDAYIDDYVLEDDSSSYTPDESERIVIKDAIMGLLVDSDFVAAYGALDLGPPVAWLYDFREPGRHTQYASVDENERRDGITDAMWVGRKRQPLYLAPKDKP